MKINSADILIPVYRPGKSFSSLLGMLKRQTFPPGHVIIINTVPDESDNSDSVEALIESVYPGLEGIILRHISRDEFDHGATRRMAVGLSDAEVFVCMTDDAVPADIYLIERLLGALESDDRIACAYARQIAGKDASPVEAFTRNFNYPSHSRVKSMDDIKELGIKTFFASNVCCAYRRDIYEEVGGFIDRAIFNEDMMYAAAVMKKGYLTCYRAEARVYHSHNHTALDELHRNFDNGLSQALHPEVFEGIHSESEGIRLVKETCTYLAGHGYTLKIPGLIIKSGAKYLGFRLGKGYSRLPGWLVLDLALNKNFVKKNVLKDDTT